MVEPETTVSIRKECELLSISRSGLYYEPVPTTCATYLTNAPGIFGAATVFISVRQLGHSVMVAERHYLGVHRGIPKDAHTLDAAMQIAPHTRN